jgi:hypothetical protein
MRFIKWAGVAAAIILAIICFVPWVVIESKGITVTGVHSNGTNFGKPGYFHFAMIIFFLFFTLMPRVWAKRANLLICALNLGWAVRNFIIIPGCEGGDCPIKKAGIYLLLFSSLIMMISALFPDMKLPVQKKAL